jgi:hypothetical protein
MKEDIQDNEYRVINREEAGHLDLDYDKLAKDWWEWASSLELYENLLMDDGSYQNQNVCLSKQNGQVINIGTTLGNLYKLPIRRKCQVPSDKYFFIAVLNCATNKIEHPELGTEADLEAFTKNFVDTAKEQDRSFTIGGVSVEYYRTRSNGIKFRYDKCGVYAAFGITSGEAIGVQNGYYSLVKFGKGNYELRIKAKANFPQNDIATNYVKAGQFVTDVIYDLEVV